MSSGRSFLTHAPEACRRLSRLYPGESQRGVEEAERELGRVRWQNDVDVAAWVVATPLHGAATLAALADDPLSIAGVRLAQVFPELYGLCVPPKVTTYEHQRPDWEERATPLLDRALRALTIAIDPAGELAPPFRSLLTTVLLFADVAKGGTAVQREAWKTRLGVDGAVHNEDSAVILDDVLRRILSKAPLSEDGRWGERAKALCAASGLVGMRLRGEVSRHALAPFHDFLRSEPDGGQELARVWSLVNRCETAAVRAGLWTDELAAAFAEEERAIFLVPSSNRLGGSPLSERIARMRGGALMTRESSKEIEGALDRLALSRLVFEGRMTRCQIWYAEAALGALSLEACVRLLVFWSGVAKKQGIDTQRTWHLDLLGLVPHLRDEDGEPRRYPVRLCETILESTPIERLLDGELGPPPVQSGSIPPPAAQGTNMPSRSSAPPPRSSHQSIAPLISLPGTKGGERALIASFSTNDEASALLSLLAIYEHKTSVAFHTTLKALCDLYALRKDDFDRVANESAYLVTMNAARSDKSRMLDFVVPGTIVEVGPGGGVVLELCAARFPDSRIVGIDASEAVIEAFKTRTKGQTPKYEMIHGDAFELERHFGMGEVSTVIFCSVLHEIFSYVPWGDPKERFRFGSVAAIVRSAFRALKMGGRIVIRDGVAPDDDPRVVEFTSKVWREGLEAFQKNYEPREINFEAIGPMKVKIGARDLFEFLTTFTWGPDSFPYEIREQRAVLPRAEYVNRLIDACASAADGAVAKEVPVPADLASYLQPGYPANIAPHLKIFDGSGKNLVSMPDVNGVWVLEKAPA